MYPCVLEIKTSPAMCVQNWKACVQSCILLPVQGSLGHNRMQTRKADDEVRASQPFCTSPPLWRSTRLLRYNQGERQCELRTHWSSTVAMLYPTRSPPEHATGSEMYTVFTSYIFVFLCQRLCPAPPFIRPLHLLSMVHIMHHIHAST